jgi:hypothetical protein
LPSKTAAGRNRRALAVSLSAAFIKAELEIKTSDEKKKRAFIRATLPQCVPTKPKLSFLRW